MKRPIAPIVGGLRLVGAALPGVAQAAAGAMHGHHPVRMTGGHDPATMHARMPLELLAEMQAHRAQISPELQQHVLAIHPVPRSGRATAR